MPASLAMRNERLISKRTPESREAADRIQVVMELTSRSQCAALQRLRSSYRATQRDSCAIPESAGVWYGGRSLRTGRWLCFFLNPRCAIPLATDGPAGRARVRAC